MRPALFWDTTQHIVALPYRRFETTDRSHIQGPNLSVPASRDLNSQSQLQGT